MATLQKLAASEQLSPLVWRILGQNAGPFTLQGTNTYLLGNKPPFVLIDTGEGRPAYTELLTAHLRAHATRSPLISDIILTHWHQDHVDGLPSVLALLQSLSSPAPRVHKFPSTHNIPHDFTPLQHNQTFTITGSSSPLKVIHTPGHSDDSISLLLPDQGIFCADTVLGEGTAVFEDLRVYMQSLSTLLEIMENGQEKLFPGHGPVREDGRELVNMYIRHRNEREGQIVDCLEGEMGLMELTKKVYAAQNLPAKVLPAAARGVSLHLRKLIDEGKVAERGELYTKNVAKM